MDSRGQPHVEKVRSEWNRRRRDTAPVLKVHELSKNFGAVRILNDVTFQMAEGEVISLIGASGSGKSTLLRCINFLETPTSGRIEVMGDAISITTNRPGKSEITNRAKIRLFRQRTGMVFQNFNLWPHRTVIGNVTEALVYVLGKGRREAEDMALSALSKVGMAEFRDRYPSQLSGGQQQRVAIARVLAMRPKIMLFDEPTSALDPELVGEVLKVIRTLAEEGATILLVTHEMRFARDVSSRMIFLRKGILEQDDAPEELFRNPASEAVKRFLSSVMPAAA
ncbi:amino acid ABC transporter ATP-binding protein [Mesorhizobium sp. M1A.F.Ca.IN.022.07.1.1]|nr:amino acid ABC transporter ATP-binding protein [Mesorhizobium sp. M1A.F.Ca.IN.022.06.1.1]RUV57088.1 amino acid ABC transporter ATP-binding protein [Mesorhizobium sp. M1A.F.Ca.IN.022.02.1.1]RUV90095.1 amino acid ABC transporter ATP-binding protein [Mesorhizobium sp. M1A.F.Ca.IN.022.07.1.1]RWG04284.1 MAG: amino acid ABC transporter ATP-binding protein [Mesorhizobium sp.]TGQ23686.1 amino acid ABC transporter ATP-binding protein [Mesorhizobium sp. M00.F.Ca.ET.217.01.1.1]TGV92587.1 amino acid AB